MTMLTALRSTAAATALLVGIAQAASAQTAAPDAVRSPRALADGVGVELVQPGAGVPTAAVDETALRYFAQKGDRPAVEATAEVLGECGDFGQLGHAPRLVRVRGEWGR